jgi:hypothetical protein
LRSAREARVELEVDVSVDDVVPLVPDDVMLGDVLVDPLVVLGDVDDMLLELDDGLVPDDVVLGEVLVELLVDGDVLMELPLVEPEGVEPVAPVPDVPAVEVEELLAFVSDEPAEFEPCDADEPVELESELLEPVPVLCAYDTPNSAAIATAVKVFGNLLIWRISCTRVKGGFRLVARCSAPLGPPVRQEPRQ